MPNLTVQSKESSVDVNGAQSDNSAVVQHNPTSSGPTSVSRVEDAPRQRSIKQLGVARPSLLRQRLELQRLVGEISTKFINLPAEGINQHICEALGQLAQFLGFDRAAINKFSGQRDASPVTHIWMAAGLPSFAPIFAEDNLPWLTKRLAQGHEVHLPDVDTLPPAAQKDRETCQRYDVQSAYHWPLRAGTDVIGSWALISIGEKRPFPDKFPEGLQLFGQIMASAL